MEQYFSFCMGEAENVNRGGASAAATDYLSVAFNMSANSNLPSAIPVSQTPQLQNDLQLNNFLLSDTHQHNLLESNMADSSSRTDISTDVDAEDRNQRVKLGLSGAGVAYVSSEKSKERNLDQKAQRRLAQNREAARKSRLRKKAYVQQLENSQLKLVQIQQELKRERQQVITGDQSHSTSGNGAMEFNIQYTRWLEEHNKHINDLRTAVNSHASDGELSKFVGHVTTHDDEMFRLKGTATKADAFHILSGMWKTPAETCFVWFGDFRPSELLKLLINRLEPMTDQQLASFNNLQQSSQKSEDALSRGMEVLQQSLSETLAYDSSGPEGSSGNYMGQMAMAMGKLRTLQGFLHQADKVRQHTLQQMHRILTTKQSARALLTTNEYYSRLRALSYLWLARPQE